MQTTYDVANRAITVGTPGNYYASNVTYAPQGAISSLLFRNGVSRAYTYNNRLQATSIIDSAAGRGCGGSGSGNWLLNVGLSWTTTQGTNNGNLMSESMSTCIGSGNTTAVTFAQSYQYDALNRINLVIDNGGGTNERKYQYDAFGNMWSTDVSGSLPASLAPTTNVYNNLNQRTDYIYQGAYSPSGNLNKLPTGPCSSPSCPYSTLT